MSKRISNNRKSRFSKTPARSKVRFGWREKQRRAMAYVLKGQFLAQLEANKGVITPEVTS